MPVTQGRTSLLRSVTYPVLSFVTVALGGVLGFLALADIGVIDAAFWLVDPTSIELHFQEHGGAESAAKAFSVLTRGLLVVSGAWIAESVLSVAFGGRIGTELRRVQTLNEIEELSDHVVVCGYGMFGRTVADRLKDRDVSVVVVENSPEEQERAVDEGHLTVSGDARREDVLREAGANRARRVVGAIDDIQTAVVVSLLAPECRMVVRVGDEMYESLARRAGADEVVIPEVITGEAVTEGV
jgi:hypothetical protein